MAWSLERSKARITNFIEAIPINEVRVDQFSDYYARRRASLAEAIKSDSTLRTDPILNLKYNSAVITNGAHIYANLLNFNEKLLENDLETSDSHKRALQFLHLHYSACDSLIKAFDIQRVDYHGHRLHAVVLTPEGPENARVRALKALSFAKELSDLIITQSDLFDGLYSTAIRIGIDSGVAVAINSGRGNEPEPLFIGSPANHAAKIADGSQQGIYLGNNIYVSSNISTDLKSIHSPSINGGLANDQVMRSLLLEAREISSADGNPLNINVRKTVESYLNDIRQKSSQGAKPAVFSFSRHSLPLKTLKFENHPPSRSVRMETACIFADIDGFTAHVDKAVIDGTINQVVAYLHIIRREFVACLRDDFGGKKIRFIGDCLHAVSAKGSNTNTDDKETVEDAILIAGGLRSSFELMQNVLPNISNLGIAIGIDYGPTPISRIGLQGTSSVRCSTSKSTCAAEQAQQDIDGHQTKLANTAAAVIPLSVYNALGYDNTIDNLDYASANILINGLASPSVQTDSFRAHTNN